MDHDPSRELRADVDRLRAEARDLAQRALEFQGRYAALWQAVEDSGLLDGDDDAFARLERELGLDALGYESSTISNILHDMDNGNRGYQGTGLSEDTITRILEHGWTLPERVDVD